MMIDIHLTVLKDCDREIRNATRLHLYHGARDILCKIVLLDRDSVGAGESCYAQLRLEEEIAVKTRRPLCPALLLSGGNHRRRCHPRLQPF